MGDALPDLIEFSDLIACLLGKLQLVGYNIDPPVIVILVSGGRLISTWRSLALRRGHTQNELANRVPVIVNGYMKTKRGKEPRSK